MPDSVPPSHSRTRVPARITMPAPGLRLARHLALACLAAACGCSSDRPMAPRAHALSGHVVLSGPFVDAAGNLAGTRVLGDADGVAVELLDGNRVLAHTTTTAGVYRFTGLVSGVYTARTRVNEAVQDETNPLTIADADIAAADTLRLAASGDLFPVPTDPGRRRRHRAHAAPRGRAGGVQHGRLGRPRPGRRPDHGPLLLDDVRRGQ